MEFIIDVTRVMCCFGVAGLFGLKTDVADLFGAPHVFAVLIDDSWNGFAVHFVDAVNNVDVLSGLVLN